MLARHVRVYPETPEEVKRAQRSKIALLNDVADGSQCAGVVRYELAHLYDLTGDYVKALGLHANNREQYRRFFRGRYRLAMSLEMIASSDPCTRMSEEEGVPFDAVLRILHRWDGTADKSEVYQVENGKLVLSTELRSYLLDAAWKELQRIRKYLTLRDVIWMSFWHRDEREVLKPYWRLRHRQSFHDGVYLAQLLVAVRQTLNDKKKALPLPHPQKILRIATAIAGDSSYIAKLLNIPYKPDKPPEQKNLQPMRMGLRTRRRPRQYSTPSWPAAYNLACVYAAIYAYRNHQFEACMRKPEDNQAKHEAQQIKNELRDLVGKVVTSLELAINNPECEMERPSEWICNDPDFGCLNSRDDQFSADFRNFLATQKQRDYPLMSTTQHSAAVGQASHRTT
jgi:hypothetical protein